MRKTLSVLAIIAALSSSALAASFATLTGGEIKNGDYRGDGNVTIASGGEVSVSSVDGKYSDASSVSGATVIMTGGTIESFVIGAEVYCGGNDAITNTVTISGGKIEGGVIGGYSYASNATSNTVTISGADSVGGVYGGYCDSIGNATGNAVTISGGEVTGKVYGGYSKKGNANGNTVTVSGGEIIGNVHGGYSSNGDATGNTVTISGGTIKGYVYGGYTGNDKIANNNTVNLVGEGATLGTLTGSSFTIEEAVIVGNNGSSITNNTLNVYGKGITVNHFVEKIETANFYLTPNIQNGDTMLTCGMFFADKVNVKCNGDTLLNDGDTVTLVHSTSGVVQYEESNVDIIKGVTASYSGKVTTDGGDIVLTIEGSTPVPGPTPGPEPTPVPGPGVKVEFDTLKSMTETRTDVAALVNATADFMSAAGLQQAKLAAKSAIAAGQDGAAPFVALGGSHLRYNTGSHVNANGFNAALGVAKAVSAVTLGVAGEYGTSDYKSYVGGVRGNGDSKLFGGAVLADWQGKQGWHAEGSVRLGRARYDYNAMTPLGHTDYSDKASYQSVGIGGGKEFKVSNKSEDTVDVYARYMYGHTNGSNAKASSGESMHFAGVNSHRTMVGARYNHELTDNATLYAGAAWMHEFDGDAHSVIGGFTSPAPTLKGNSGMVELGTTFAPMDSQNVLINLNVQGWTGVQRGISGGAGCTIKF